MHRRLSPMAIRPPQCVRMCSTPTQIEMEARTKFGLGGRVRFNGSVGLRPRGCGLNRLVSMAFGVAAQIHSKPFFHHPSISSNKTRTHTHTSTLDRGGSPEADTPTDTIMAESSSPAVTSGGSSLKTQADAVAATVVPPAPVKAPAAAVPPGKLCWAALHWINQSSH